MYRTIPIRLCSQRTICMIIYYYKYVGAYATLCLQTFHPLTNKLGYLTVFCAIPMITVKGINNFTGYVSPVTFYILATMLSKLVIPVKNGDP